jgi:hypothetical protein
VVITTTTVCGRHKEGEAALEDAYVFLVLMGSRVRLLVGPIPPLFFAKSWWRICNALFGHEKAFSHTPANLVWATRLYKNNNVAITFLGYALANFYISFVDLRSNCARPVLRRLVFVDMHCRD